MKAINEKTQMGAVNDAKQLVESERLSDPKRRFDWIFGVMADCSLKCLPTALHFAFRLFPADRKNKEIWAGYDSIAAAIGSNPTTVKRATGEMIDKGWLQRYRKFGQSYRHFLSFPKGAKVTSLDEVDIDPSKGAKVTSHTGRNRPLISVSDSWEGNAKHSPTPLDEESSDYGSEEEMEDMEKRALEARSHYPEISFQEFLENTPPHPCVEESDSLSEDDDEADDDCPF